ncbi:hypothetical protein B0H19DRAFT_1366357, partial [Mycena capillaripes]
MTFFDKIAVASKHRGRFQNGRHLDTARAADLKDASGNAVIDADATTSPLEDQTQFNSTRPALNRWRDAADAALSKRHATESSWPISERTTTESRNNDDSRFGHIPHEYFEESQRTLSTIIVAGTFMAGVEAQLVTLSLSSEGKHEAYKTISICFGMIALFSTAFAALYSAATYIWLKQDWENGPKRFEEWVAASMRTMIRWCSTFLVAGIYAGFLGFIFFLFNSASLTVAVFGSVAFVLCGLCPMAWGLYYWLGLYQGWLEWYPSVDGSSPR